MKNRNIFQQFSFSRSTCCTESDGLPKDGLRAIINSGSNLTQDIFRKTTEVEKKRWIKREFWRIPELMAHLDNDLYF